MNKKQIHGILRRLQDKTFIAHAREDFPALLDYIETRNKFIEKTLEDNLRLRAENEALKSRLEKSVELPCKCGDTVFNFDVDNKIWESQLLSIDLKLKPKELSPIFIVNVKSFGKTIFLARENAEKALKEREAK